MPQHRLPDNLLPTQTSLYYYFQILQVTPLKSKSPHTSILARGQVPFKGTVPDLLFYSINPPPIFQDLAFIAKLFFVRNKIPLWPYIGQTIAALAIVVHRRTGRKRSIVDFLFPPVLFLAPLELFQCPFFLRLDFQLRLYFQYQDKPPSGCTMSPPDTLKKLTNSFSIVK